MESPVDTAGDNQNANSIISKYGLQNVQSGTSRKIINDFPVQKYKANANVQKSIFDLRYCISSVGYQNLVSAIFQLFRRDKKLNNF